MQFIKSVFSSKNTTSTTTPIIDEKENIEQSIQETLNRNMAPSYSLFFERLETSMIPSFVGLAPKSGYSSTFSLTDFQVDAVVTDSTVTSVYTQKYKNSSPNPVEARYQMPLAPGAAVSKFVVTYDDKVLSAKIKEKEAAANKYNDAVASGNQAFLVEKKSNGTFTTMIGNLPPTKEVTISITIVSEIGTHLENLHFGLHRYMFPKYSFNLNLNLQVSLSVPIQKIELDHYKADIQVDGKKATIKLSETNGVPNNIIAVIRPDSSERPAYFVEKSKDNTYALGINFYPTLEVAADEVDQCSEFIFLIDCSGSMSGSTIEKAKRCLEILMRSLTEKSKFNIWLFGSSFKSQFTESKLYNDQTLEQASVFIKSIDADLGGTELLPPIQAIISQPVDSQYPRQVFILTDGEVSQRDELVDYVAKEAGTTRIFTLGIGSGVDKLLVEGLSKACRGYFEFIDDNSMMETQVMKLMSIAMEPIIANIQVNWDGLPVVQAPKSVRPIFNHERLFLYGLLESVPENLTTKTIVITADGPTGQSIRYEIPVDFKHAQSESNAIHTLTANMIIRDLEEDEKKKKDANKDAIVKLGKKYQLISNHTSFVVVAEADKPTEETMQVVEVVDAPPVPSPQYNYNSFTHSAPTSALNYSSPTTTSAMNYYSSMPTQTIDYDLDDCALECEQEEALDCIQEKLEDMKCLSMDLNESICRQSEVLDSLELRECAPEKSVKKSASPASFFSSFTKTKSKEASPPPPVQAPAPVQVSYLSAPSPVQSAPSTQPSYSSAPGKKSSSSGDLMMDLIRSQKANGSWNTVTFKLPSKPDTLSSLSDDCWVTLCVIATFNKSFAAEKTQWQQIVAKASKWVKSQLNASNLGDKYDTFLALATSSI
ncbi:type A von Willebrand factor domain-containing protein [Heterostelium album PN500]|uniref:Type A von Willebrand factor domain-containing protein n=1 Tax=Heterostelium pallidum (strain ATCC 26659 / Pp 5 / PN500) TaxID=670386 RepID=D3B083_HETP5|nr:type A von Willebrand factor domain-containing protein [Heterostelium album PN500]EFA84707.1 type A von Willebrand factor domain-containing protein [Heterostelium album PN500]|eukprot:XP_020436820.1 type A von Willebrand factor domain-containing protein [Heterostelium album PN500]